MAWQAPTGQDLIRGAACRKSERALCVVCSGTMGWLTCPHGLSCLWKGPKWTMGREPGTASGSQTRVGTGIVGLGEPTQQQGAQHLALTSSGSDATPTSSSDVIRIHLHPVSSPDVVTTQSDHNQRCQHRPKWNPLAFVGTATIPQH